MSLERMTGMIESLGEQALLRTEAGRFWSLRPAPGTLKERLALLDFRIGQHVEVLGYDPSGAKDCFTVLSQRFPDGSQINLMSHLPAKERFA